MKKLILIVALVFAVCNANAHNPETASVYVKPINGIWVMQLSFSQTGVHNALTKSYTDIDWNTISTNEYKTKFISYLKEHLDLDVDGQHIAITSGGIKLGSHQTDVKLLLPDFPNEFKSVTANFDILNENSNQNTVVSFQNGEKSVRKILNNKNGFLISFDNSVQGFNLIDNKTKSKFNYLYVIFIVGVICLGVYSLFIYRKRKESTPNLVIQ